MGGSLAVSSTPFGDREWHLPQLEVSWIPILFLILNDIHNDSIERNV
jgi:hypothetical protein